MHVSKRKCVFSFQFEMKTDGNLECDNVALFGVDGSCNSIQFSDADIIFN